MKGTSSSSNFWPTLMLFSLPRLRSSSAKLGFSRSIACAIRRSREHRKREMSARDDVGFIMVRKGRMLQSVHKTLPEMLAAAVIEIGGRRRNDRIGGERHR